MKKNKKKLMANWRKEYLDAAETKTKKRVLAFDHKI